MKYYLLYLNNNSCSNKTKVENVILKEDIPNIEETISYDSLEVLAYENSKFFDNYMIDVLTKKKIYFSDEEILPHITYNFKKEVSDDELINIYEKYKNLTIEDIERYENGLNKIEEESINKYNDYMNKLNEKENKFKNASEFLSSLIN